LEFKPGLLALLIPIKTNYKANCSIINNPTQTHTLPFSVEKVINPKDM